MGDRVSVVARALRAAFCLVLAGLIWLPNVHRLHAVDLAAARRPDGPFVRGLVARQIGPADAPPSRGDVARMREVNPEWDFMARTYTTLALANLALSDATRRDRYLAAIDAIVDDTLRVEREQGRDAFLLGYARGKPFVDPSARSMFIDGEVLAMAAARDLVQRDARMAAVARERAKHVEASMLRSPTLSGESYPDEAWTFCNTTALAGLAMLDRAEGTDHRDLLRAWVERARERLVDPATGLLVSSFTREGHVLDGPEGSSLWMSAHNLLVVDEAFARDQYARARRELSGGALGFAWAREWPRVAAERPDVDSGPIVPIVEASAGSSGLAILGAAAFGDDAYLSGLFASLELAAYPARANGEVRYRASNRVGDAVLLYAMSVGPLWARVRGDGPVASTASIGTLAGEARR
jgi:hypothetical protein